MSARRQSSCRLRRRRRRADVGRAPARRGVARARCRPRAPTRSSHARAARPAARAAARTAPSRTGQRWSARSAREVGATLPRPWWRSWRWVVPARVRSRSTAAIAAPRCCTARISRRRSLSRRRHPPKHIEHALAEPVVAAPVDRRAGDRSRQPSTPTKLGDALDDDDAERRRDADDATGLLPAGPRLGRPARRRRARARRDGSWSTRRRADERACLSLLRARGAVVVGGDRAATAPDPAAAASGSRSGSATSAPTR